DELDEVVDGESDADLDIVNGTDPAYTTQSDDRGFDLGAGMGDDIGVSEPAKKYHVKGVPVKVMAQRIQYYDTDGKLVTESFQDYTRKTFSKQFASLDEFIKRWNATERKQT